MDREAIARLLQELREELEQSPSLRTSDREHLEQLVEEIQADLLRVERNGVAHPPLIDRLQDATQSFEVSHPKVTAVLGRVIDALSQMGI